MASTDNPFAALLSESKSGIDKQLIEDIFLFTLKREQSSPNSSKSRKALLCLADVIVCDSGEDGVMGEELLSHAIFERLMLIDTKEYLVHGEGEDDALQVDPMIYLHRAFLSCERLKSTQPNGATDYEKIRSLIITNGSTCMRQPDLFPGQPIWKQWKKIMLTSVDTNTSETMDFIVECIQKIYAEDEPLEALGALKSNFYPLLSKIETIISQSNILTIKSDIFWLLSFFVRDKRIPQMGEVLIDFTIPNPNTTGGAYMDTLFGSLFSLSILPKNTNGPYEFFNDISLESKGSDPALWQIMSRYQNDVFCLIKQLLVQSPTTKQKMLQWVAKCLSANVSRGHLWNNLNAGIENVVHQNASDAFMLGLTSVLLRLCAPLCEPTMKVLLVDPTYCGVPDDEREEKGVNMLKAFEETALLPTEENTKRTTAAKFNFITELFFLTHKAYELSYRACIERFAKMSRELQNLQSSYQDVASADPNNEMAKNLMRMLKQHLQKYLCLRNCLMEPENDTALIKFFEASAIWLVEVALISPEELESMHEFAPLKRRNKKLPQKIEFTPHTLRCIPENIVDNIISYLNFNRHFAPGHFIEFYPSSHDAFFKMIVLFMGAPEFIKNPHLRAKLAEALELFLKKQSAVGTTFLAHVFDNHPDRSKVVASLLNVFVSIEMTGQSVQFEQKFNYRRPMYAIIEYLWTKEEYVQNFRDLAAEAEGNMEAIEPPLFLRFINLLINDAIFLLDESLNNLQQIRQLQEAQASGEWNNLPQNERQQNLSNLHHLGMLARFDNILGRDTINILKLITTEIKSIFCHNSMVDRITSMLNYFLLNLVGPQKEKFKVKDKKEFEFDPAKTVIEICHIYVNLSCSDSFCLAVSQDGRSYSSQLFSYAENILIRIGGGQLIGEMAEFSEKVQRLEKQYKQELEYMADAPDEYLDPIMSTLMTDPVILPSSKVTVDRSTIARHLLSDQTDPFNRAPLTMDKVTPNVELKQEIEKWLADKRKSGPNVNNDQ
ncbi:ubiquitin conjugation factor E4 A [Musca vetustissima]|uniref:ubiquitin conjugation factor E4 A n=1 Tax=Musca vetustissima TaxID=27455 RepID=UPI002AB65231|nr:ubiquitin conjugation factor E4 A [Musca vetustissima]